MQIEINGTKYDGKIETFHTQAGQQAVRVISNDAPIAEGFKVYVGGNMVADMSDYTNLYREDGVVKEYTVESEEIIPAEGYKSGIPVSALDRRLDAMSQRITEVTPYTYTRMAYYGESQRVFYGVPNGNTSIFFDNYDGEYTVERISDRLYVKFVKEENGEKVKNRLQKMTSITIMVQ